MVFDLCFPQHTQHTQHTQHISNQRLEKRQGLIRGLWLPGCTGWMAAFGGALQPYCTVAAIAGCRSALCGQVPLASAWGSTNRCADTIDSVNFCGVFMQIDFSFHEFRAFQAFQVLKSI
jgi:hypothetical protein